MTVTIDYLLNQKSHLAEVAKWQHNQFGYLNPSTTIQQRASKLNEALQLERLPVSLVAISGDGQLLGSANVLATTLTHQHLTPWLSSVYVPVEHRGKGIASALSLRAAEEAGRLNFKKIYLFTPRSENLYATGMANVRSETPQRRIACNHGKGGVKFELGLICELADDLRVEGIGPHFSFRIASGVSG